MFWLTRHLHSLTGIKKKKKIKSRSLASNEEDKTKVCFAFWQLIKKGSRSGPTLFDSGNFPAIITPARDLLRLYYSLFCSHRWSPLPPPHPPQPRLLKRALMQPFFLLLSRGLQLLAVLIVKNLQK